jgi:outer membrane biosynthesis protein TonB
MRIFVTCLVMLVLSSCRHVPAEAVGAGSSSFRVVEARRAPADPTVIVGDVGEPSVRPRYYQDYRPAAPRRNQPPPVYPARALKAKAGAATVGVRVTVDVSGKVTDIGPSLLVFSAPGPYADDFLEAVKATVGRWQFNPAEILHMEHVETPQVFYDRIARREPVEAQLDLAFTFTATGGVLAGK